MRGMTVVTAAAVLGVASVLSAAPDQDPVPQTPSQTPSQAPPVFRGEVDVIRLDVSVLDRDRRPVTGLAADDFIVIEDGVQQRIAAVSEVVVADRDPKPTAWMRHVTADVASNDLVDQLGDGRPYAIVMDDANVPGGDWFEVHNARAAARRVITGMAPSDIAAVVFPMSPANNADFTTDRNRLLDAVDRFEGRPERDMDWMPLQTQDPPPPNPLIPKAPAAPWAPGGFAGGTGGADMPSRFSPLLARSRCQQRAPLGATLEVVAGRLAMIPNRRKTIVLISVGMGFGNAHCRTELHTQMNGVLRIAQRANINIYSVDVADRQFTTTIHDVGREFLESTAEETGGQVVGGDDEHIVLSVDRIFEEAGSYYLVGYEPSNGAPDGTYRQLEVRVKRPGLIVRSRSGYYARDGNRLVTGENEIRSDDLGWSSLLEGFVSSRRPPSVNAFALAGLPYPATLPLTANVVPVGLASTGRDDGAMDVAIVLSVRLPPARIPLDETLVLVRHVYDHRGKPGPPSQEIMTMALQPSGGDALRYDVFQRMTLTPGRYEVRLNATSRALDRGASVFAPLEVPDVARAPVTLSGVVLGAPSTTRTGRTDVLAPILPIVPTSTRTFTASDAIVAYVSVFQGAGAPVPVTLNAVVLDWRDRPVLEISEPIVAEAFADAGVARQIALPLERLIAGPYLLTITAERSDGTKTRRDVMFRVR
jgi:VWFA-related protein